MKTAGIDANQYDEQFVVLFSLTMAQLKQVSQILPSSCFNVCSCFMLISEVAYGIGDAGFSN